MTNSREASAQLLGLGAAAQYLGVHPITLRRWADQGDIAVMLTPGGHRRFAMSDLRRFAEARKIMRVGSGLEQSWADQALQRTRQDISGQGEQRWLLSVDEADREHKRALGRRLMGVMLQYVSLSQGGEELLNEAETIGRSYAENAVVQGLSLVEALSAMFFFRDTLIESAVQMPESARVRPEANARLVRRINGLLNTVQLAIASVYEQAQR